jgi:hypothetical protein
MLSTWLILSKFVTFHSTFVYDCTALVPVAGHFKNPRFLGSAGYVKRTIGEVAA